MGASSIGLGLMGASSIFKYNAERDSANIESEYYKNLSIQKNVMADIVKKKSYNDAINLRDKYAKATSDIMKQAEESEATAKTAMASAGLSSASVSAQNLEIASLLNQKADEDAIREAANYNINETLKQGIYDYYSLKMQANEDAAKAKVAKSMGKVKAFSGLLGDASSIALFSGK